jgi:hypothetical protein
VYPFALFLALLALSTSPSGLPPEGVSEEDVQFSSGEVEIGALLLMPHVGEAMPAVVIVQGSGDSDRTNGWSRAIADPFAELGIAALLTDKRGCGASQGDWRTVGFDELAEDALAGVEYLSGRPEVDASRIGLVGLSQGGWVVPVAAARSDDVAFVIDVSGTSVGFLEQVHTEMANSARAAGLSEADVTEVLRFHRRIADYLHSGDWDAYERALTRAKESTWGALAEGFPSAPDLPIWSFLRSVAFFDPMPYWLQVDVPVLVVFGEDDEKDNVPVEESVRRLEFGFGLVRKTDYVIEVIEGAGHGLLDPTRSRLMDEFVDALARWLGEHV